MFSIAKSKVFDRIFKLLMVVPMVCYWRGLWDLYTSYFFFLPQPFDCWAITAVGSAFVAAYFVYPLVHRKIRELKPLLKQFITRLTLFIGGVLMMGYWRGVWGVADYYLAPYGLRGSVTTLVVCYSFLLLMLTSRSIIFTPFILLADNSPDSLVPAPWFNVQPRKTVKSCFCYALDSFFTHFIISTTSIFAWYGLICVLDSLQAPSLSRHIHFIIIGLALCLMLFALEYPIKKLSSMLFGVEVSSFFSATSTQVIFSDFKRKSKISAKLLEKKQELENEKPSDLIRVEQTDENNDLKKQLLTKLTPKSDFDIQIPDETKNLKHNYPNSLKVLEDSIQNSRQDLSNQQSSTNDSLSVTRISIEKLPSQTHLPSVTLKTSEKLKILIFEDIIGIFEFVSMSFLWLGSWGMNVYVFNLGEAANAWINFIGGSIILLFFGVISFAGACGCARDMPLVTPPCIVEISVSSDKPIKF